MDRQTLSRRNYHYQYAALRRREWLWLYETQVAMQVCRFDQ